MKSDVISIDNGGKGFEAAFSRRKLRRSIAD